MKYKLLIFSAFVSFFALNVIYCFEGAGIKTTPDLMKFLDNILSKFEHGVGFTDSDYKKYRDLVYASLGVHLKGAEDLGDVDLQKYYKKEMATVKDLKIEKQDVLLIKANFVIFGKQTGIETTEEDIIRILKDLIENQKLDVNHWFFQTSLLFGAIKAGLPNVVEYLIQSGAKKDIENIEEFTPLGLAVFHHELGDRKNDYKLIIKILLDQKANPNLGGITPLSINSDPDIAKLLIDHGADVKQAEEDFAKEHHGGIIPPEIQKIFDEAKKKK